MRTPAAPARHTPYMAMSIKSNQIPTQYNALAAVCAWITLAGFIGGKALQEAVRNVQLLPLAGVLCSLGVVGTCWLWWKWQTNYVWLIAHVFVPGVSHSLIALFSVVSISIVSTLCGIMIMLTVVYTKLLDNIITPFDKQVARQ
ncbi:hypothetical protein B0T11DRAFT_329515 [Plectosphaerella cucumerina]|uniref:Uncharacterized protein n=1 Tax=Plectosphaerella cucumerina TaxID=40658 RepID=A0A8K0TNF3_9PEZI|nr:hypothetical protein B0T11DRAFT_329515 [Plectosphaerella cucumerina]